MEMKRHVPVLIVGAGPIGLALAVDLGWRGIECLVLEQSDGVIEHPRATAENARTMEFFRRWGIAEGVRNAGAPPDLPHTVLYLTSLSGFEIARFDRPGHGGSKPTSISPERPQRCNQLWLDPILRDRASSFSTVSLCYGERCEFVAQNSDDVQITVRNLASDEQRLISADYLVDCSGSHSTIRRFLGIDMSGPANTDYHVSAFIRAPELWKHHDKGKAALIHFLTPKGPRRNLILLDGRELYRFAITGRQYYDDPDSVDVIGLFDEVAGPSVPREVISVRRWSARDVVADGYRNGRIFLAGDAAHINHPDGGFGLNTGMGDAVDLGWKLAAVIDGWGAPNLLDSYEIERRPVGLRNVRQAHENLQAKATLALSAEVFEASKAGADARRKLGDGIRQNSLKNYVTDGTALGYSYASSPICLDDGSPPLPDTITEYTPSARPGARAPHAWLADGRSTLDLFGLGFALLHFNEGNGHADAFERAFAQRHVPLKIVQLRDPSIRNLYEKDLVLVRPDGHVAWRSDEWPADPTSLVERIRGAAM